MGPNRTTTRVVPKDNNVLFVLNICNTYRRRVLLIGLNNYQQCNMYKRILFDFVTGFHGGIVQWKL